MDKTITWRRSTRSGSESNCVELPGTLDAVRDSKNPDGAVLKGEIAALVAAVKTGTIGA
jgi:hypothetical protein